MSSKILKYPIENAIYAAISFLDSIMFHFRLLVNAAHCSCAIASALSLILALARPLLLCARDFNLHNSISPIDSAPKRRTTQEGHPTPPTIHCPEIRSNPDAFSAGLLDMPSKCHPQ
jgi:hypothetical protein